MAQKISRTWLMIGAGGLLALGLSYAFWPSPVLVEMGEASRLRMAVTVDEEAKTRVRDAYVVSAPIAGRLLRVNVKPGDAVERGVSTIARMLPIHPSALDIRTREQARAAVSAAEAAVRVARADLNKVMADKELSDLEIERTRTLFKKGTIAKVLLDRAERSWRSASASLDTAKAAISLREAELANARAQLITFGEKSLQGGAIYTGEKTMSLTAPVSGRILRVMQESEVTLSAGTPILEIGNISSDLEIVAELLSTDAVQVSAGDRVIITNWGGAAPLDGRVERVEPWGFTKFSALGVEEQRVNVIIKFTEPLTGQDNLGHGYRLETQIIVWEDENVLAVPSSAIFREKGGWAVFTAENGRAHLRIVKVGRTNGTHAQILSGINAGEKIILYPGPSIIDGTHIKNRKVS